MHNQDTATAEPGGSQGTVDSRLDRLRRLGVVIAAGMMHTSPAESSTGRSPTVQRNASRLTDGNRIARSPSLSDGVYVAG